MRVHLPTQPRASVTRFDTHSADASACHTAMRQTAASARRRHIESAARPPLEPPRDGQPSPFPPTWWAPASAMLLSWGPRVYRNCAGAALYWCGIGGGGGDIDPRGVGGRIHARGVGWRRMSQQGCTVAVGLNYSAQLFCQNCINHWSDFSQRIVFQPKSRRGLLTHSRRGFCTTLSSVHPDAPAQHRRKKIMGDRAGDPSCGGGGSAGWPGDGAVALGGHPQFQPQAQPGSRGHSAAPGEPLGGGGADGGRGTAGVVRGGSGGGNAAEAGGSGDGVGVVGTTSEGAVELGGHPPHVQPLAQQGQPSDAAPSEPLGGEGAGGGGGTAGTGGASDEAGAVALAAPDDGDEGPASCSSRCSRSGPTSWGWCSRGWTPRTAPYSRGSASRGWRRWCHAGCRAQGREARSRLSSWTLSGPSRGWLGRRRTDARGGRRRAPESLGAGTWRFCSGRGSTTARGTRSGRVHTRQWAGTWRCCSGRGSAVARGMKRKCAVTPLGAGIWRCCSGCETAGARGPPRRARAPLWAGTWRC